MCMHTHKRKQYNLILNRLREIRRKKNQREELICKPYIISLFVENKLNSVIAWNEIPFQSMMYCIFYLKRKKGFFVTYEQIYQESVQYSIWDILWKIRLQAAYRPTTNHSFYSHPTSIFAETNTLFSLAHRMP